ncbi:hypothetical protein [Pleionea sp. CnH1-48]|uniref:hypothetical protein n=1 Tax=Pleionea sp. CnH1-48 TaxID=2954494 RepID=UPI0020975C35|nr:hypothetical protein [Pleionea sp. CnH1-48]MCO7222675.1 hypothetical protein [Pleionea sp. CnH1-48]
MKDDLDFETLSNSWLAQPVDNGFNKKQLKRKLIAKKLGLLAVSILELFVILAMVWLLFTAFVESWAIHTKLWIFFGLFVGFFALIPALKSRFLSYQMIATSTSNWIDLEEKMSMEALYRGRLTNYIVFVFSVAVAVSFIYELVFLGRMLSDILFNYCFGIFWLILAWFINHRKIKKHNDFLSTLK